MVKNCLQSIMFLGVLMMGLTGGVTAASTPGAMLKLDFQSGADREKLDVAQASQIEQLPVAASGPVIDGKLDDAAWAGAMKVASWTAAATPTRAMLVAHGDALSVAIICGHDAGAQLVASQLPRDAQIHREDCVEIWIGNGSKGRGANLFHFVVNPAGSFMDMDGRDKSFNPMWSVATSRHADHWIVEMTIPMKELGFSTTAGLELPFNIGRNGPYVKPTAWRGKYGTATATKLRFPGETAPIDAGESLEAMEGDAQTASVGQLVVSQARAVLEPGERWVRVELAIPAKAGRLESLEMEAALYAAGADAPLAQVRERVTHRRPVAWADLRQMDLPAARLVVTLRKGQTTLGVVEQLLVAKPTTPALPAGERVEIKIDVPEGIDPRQERPVTFGFPLPEGGLWDARSLRLVDRHGKSLPMQSEVTGRWAKEGAIKWLRFDAMVIPADGCFVEAASGEDVTPAALTLTREGDEVLIDTGTAQLVLGAEGSPVRSISQGGRMVATVEGSRGLYVIDQHGKLGRASAKGSTVEVEAAGPVAACVRIEGIYADDQGQEMARHITRVEAFAGQSEARVTHTLVLTQDTNKRWFKEVGWELKASVGSQPTGVFNTSREQWNAYAEQSLAGNDVTAFMLQDRHMQFRAGDNHYYIGVERDGQVSTVREGQECGDWSALQGRDAFLVLACREAARQHPKEFMLAGDLIGLKLFSNRAGDELDFRMASMMPRWNLDAWHAAGGIPRKYVPGAQDRIRKQASNAIGWSKTHTLTLAAMPGWADREQVASVGRLNTQPVLAIADPRWTRKTEVMGPLHPRDVERFAPQEEVISGTFDWWEKRNEVTGEYGFVDYYAGPHLSYRAQGFIQMRRYPLTYSLRSDLWLLYARSGDRRIWNMAAATNRTFMDGYMCRWSGDGKIKGTYLQQSGSPSWVNGDSPESLPMYWQGQSLFTIGGSTNLNQFLWFYYLTGDRRAREAVEDYAAAVKQTVDADRARRDWRHMRLLATVSQCYAFTEDEWFRGLADALVDYLYEPDGASRITPDKPYGALYKTHSDSGPLLDAWHILRDPRVGKMVQALASHWNHQYLASQPVLYGHPTGLMSHVEYRRTQNPAIATGMWLTLRRVASMNDPQTGTFPGYRMIAADMQGVFQTLPYGMALVADTNADRQPVSSWAAMQVGDEQTSLLVRKGYRQRVELRLIGYSKRASVGEAGGQLNVRLVSGKIDHPTSQKENQIIQASGKTSRVIIPLEAAAGVYQITGLPQGEVIVLADRPVPMVVLAPEGLMPAPAMTPSMRVFFHLSSDAQQPAVELEQPGILYQPDGTPYAQGEPVKGRVNLPADQVGVWSVKAVEQPGRIKLHNIPSAFAFDHAGFHFDPPATFASVADKDDDDE